MKNKQFLLGENRLIHAFLMEISVNNILVYSLYNHILKNMELKFITAF